MTDPAPPAPQPTADSTPFWTAAARGELILQRCLSCDRAQHPPRRFCVHCHTDTLQWQPVAPQGRLISFTHVERGPSRAFREPYTLVLVALEGGARMMLGLRGEDRLQASIGDRVCIGFGPADPAGLRLPYARLEAGTGA